jgi:hypothetical protein
MLSRTFAGEIKIARHFSFGIAELAYPATTSALLTLLRFVDISELTGKFLPRIL